MAILINPPSEPQRWKSAFVDLLGGEDLRWWPAIGDPADIEYLIAWDLPTASLAELSNLDTILSLGAGTEQWQGSDVADVPVVRLADPAMADEMAAYSLAWVLRHQRRFADAERYQRDGEWREPQVVATPDYRVGVLGYGEIGSRIGRAFADLGFVVNAWTRTARDTPGATNFAGLDGTQGLTAFLESSDAIINVLPATPATVGLLDPTRLAQVPQGSVLVNIGRGSVFSSEADLLAALDSGPLAAAVLDVTDPEPPEPDSPLFTHPAVTLTAHTAGVTHVDSAARLVAANISRLRTGQAPFPLLDRSRGY